MTAMDDARAGVPEAEGLIDGFTPEQLRHLCRSVILRPPATRPGRSRST